MQLCTRGCGNIATVPYLKAYQEISEQSTMFQSELPLSCIQRARCQVTKRALE